MTSRENPYNQQTIVMVVLSFFSVWLLGFLFDPTLFHVIHPIFSLQQLSMLTVLVHIIGYVVFIIIINNPYKSKKFISLSTSVMIFGALLIFFTNSSLAIIFYLLSSFLSSGFMVSIAYYLKETIRKKDRFSMMAIVLVVSNIGLFILEELVLFTSEWVAIVFVFLLLVISWMTSYYLKPIFVKVDALFYHTKKLHEHTKRDLLLLSVLILIITINGGLMYQVIVPSYLILGNVVNHTWLWPYMFGVVLYLALVKKVAKGTILMFVVAMLGLSFVGYLVLTINIASFFIVIFLLMISLGALDLFWWSTLSGMLDETTYPGFVFGGGLLANVIGVSIGMLLSVFIVDSENVSILVVSIAMTSIFIVLALVPFLNHLLSNKSRLQTILNEPVNNSYSKDPVLISIINSLSEREFDITMKLLQGKTYKMIGEDMHLSVNTIKFHIKSVYEKFEVSSRFDLLLLFDEHANNEKLPTMGSDINT